MKREQLHQIKEIYDMLEKGLTHPLKTTTAFLNIQPDATPDTPMRVKQNAIQRFMMLSYRDEYDAMKRQEAIDAILPPLQDAIGTIDNLKQQSHKESAHDDLALPHDDIHNFLTKKEKESLANDDSGTALIIEKDGKKTSTRSPKSTEKKRTKVEIKRR
jgi:hypothetical protein